MFTPVIFLGLGLSLAWGSHAQRVSKQAVRQTNKWLFTTEAEMLRLLPQYIRDPKATYAILIRADKLGLSSKATSFYYQTLKKKEAAFFNSLGNPKIKSEPLKSKNNGYIYSAFSFAHFLETTPVFNSKKASSSSPHDTPRHAAEADFYREKALEYAPASSTVWLESGISTFFSSAGSGQGLIQQQQGIKFIEKSVQLTPQWADSHYWLAMSYSNMAFEYPDKAKIYSAKAIAACRKAEALEPRLSRDCLNISLVVYSALGQSVNALKSLDAYAKKNPLVKSQSWFVDKRKVLSRKINSSKNPKN